MNGDNRRAGLMQAVESYRLWPEGPGFESRSPRIAQARVRLATDTLPQTLHRAGALCTGYALLEKEDVSLGSVHISPEIVVNRIWHITTKKCKVIYVELFRQVCYIREGTAGHIAHMVRKYCLRPKKKCNSHFSMSQTIWSLTKSIQKCANIYDTE